jgi:hypothetical protein
MRETLDTGAGARLAWWGGLAYSSGRAAPEPLPWAGYGGRILRGCWTCRASPAGRRPVCTPSASRANGRTIGARGPSRHGSAVGARRPSSPRPRRPGRRPVSFHRGPAERGRTSSPAPPVTSRFRPSAATPGTAGRSAATPAGTSGGGSAEPPRSVAPTPRWNSCSRWHRHWPRRQAISVGPPLGNAGLDLDGPEVGA